MISGATVWPDSRRQFWDIISVLGFFPRRRLCHLYFKGTDCTYELLSHLMMSIHSHNVNIITDEHLKLYSIYGVQLMWTEAALLPLQAEAGAGVFFFLTLKSECKINEGEL